ncbi:hypothetical protein N8T08_006092 [Aspergillus melleus]|uniref:Uncharacterized protein n=1 Tax=Aspergillus melleus TaxID=138277 RepID=A0ACC3B0N2_9EURO|nr:hypothetical protein N8T08_006092 [Aspergillus melleus]
MTKHNHNHTPRLHRVGKWMPPSTSDHHAWLGGVIAHVDSPSHEKPLHPVLVDFQSLIAKNTRIHMLLHSMFDEIPTNRTYTTDPTGCPQIRDPEHLLQVLNYLLTTAPSWNELSKRVGLVGLPINAVLDWPMGTGSGYAAFLDPEVNAMIKRVLDAWGEFLSSRESAKVLGQSETGWLGPTGKEWLVKVANQGRENGLGFEELYICDPEKEYHGFNSWDDFFTRRFREGVRPVAAPEDDDVLVNACESQPYKLAKGAKARDRFWIKEQPYSVDDMLAHDELAEEFAGGTVYQAFLSALSYHRWHAPVSGRIVKAYVVPGTYYSEPLFEGLGDPNATAQASNEIDPSGEVTAQEYLTATATRAVIFIESDNPKIGLMAFLGVGMCEVSTCDVRVKEGQHVTKGDEIGMFHFGGSTHCLLFRPGVNVDGFPNTKMEENVPVRSRLAVVH